QAVGEAEVELASMSKAGTLDLVLTEDSDSMLFGTLLVARECGKEHSQNFNMTLYYSINVETHPVLGFTPEDLIFIAIMSGGDYSKGLVGCRIQISSQLAQAGFGRRLIKGIHDSTGALRDQFLHEWCRDICSTLWTNSLGSCHPHLANNFPDDFPDLNVLNLYLHPACLEQSFAALTFSCSEPQAVDLTCFAAVNF
ncbi:hypothetical protein PILCRDRAFT_76654, partial [Piloderma croceum F 1598]